jgi:hypothetical protein
VSRLRPQPAAGATCLEDRMMSPDELAEIRRAVADFDDDSLDDAWADAEAAPGLFMGITRTMIRTYGDGRQPETEWTARASDADGHDVMVVGPSPAGALRALARQLRTD